LINIADLYIPKTDRWKQNVLLDCKIIYVKFIDCKIVKQLKYEVDFILKARKIREEEGNLFTK